LIAKYENHCLCRQQGRRWKNNAMRRSHKSAVLDLDPQGSLTAWWNKRESEAPELVQSPVSELSLTIEKASDAGFEFLFIHH